MAKRPACRQSPGAAIVLTLRSRALVTQIAGPFGGLQAVAVDQHQTIDAAGKIRVDTKIEELHAAGPTTDTAAFEQLVGAIRLALAERSTRAAKKGNTPVVPPKDEIVRTAVVNEEKMVVIQKPANDPPTPARNPMGAQR